MRFNIQIVRAGILPAWGQPRWLSQLIQVSFLRVRIEYPSRLGNRLIETGDRPWLGAGVNYRSNVGTVYPMARAAMFAGAHFYPKMDFLSDRVI